MKNLSEDAILIREAKKIVHALGKMFAPCCEVVLHDLRKPSNAIIAIECPLSGRKIGEPTTEMGLERIKNPKFPEVVQNYPNTFPDGRKVKSTSIGIKNNKGKCIASICLNMDISLFSTFNQLFNQLTSLESNRLALRETLRSRTSDDLEQIIEKFAVENNTQPRALSPQQRKKLVELLANTGMLQLRGAPSIVAKMLGITRASIYNLLKNTKEKNT